MNTVQDKVSRPWTASLRDCLNEGTDPPDLGSQADECLCDDELDGKVSVARDLP